MKRIVVTIDQMGKAVVEAQGFDGIGCTEATGPIERALSDSSTRVEKPEFFNSGEVGETEKAVQW